MYKKTPVQTSPGFPGPHLFRAEAGRFSLTGRGGHLPVLYLLGIGVALAGALAMPHIRSEYVTFMALAGLAVLLAVFLPSVFLGLYTMVAILPGLFLINTEMPETWTMILPGIDVNDILLGAMALAVGIWLFLRRPGLWGIRQRPMVTLLLVLGLWFAYEIFRNFDIYGLSSLGEFRAHYLILVLPLYVAALAETPAIRLRFFKILVFFSLVVPLLCIPFIGSIKGWQLSQDNRFFPASISFGILLGLVSCLVAQRLRIFRMPPLALAPLFLAALFMIVFDSHRSVWFPGLALMALLFAMDRQSAGAPGYKRPGILVLILFLLLAGAAVFTSDTAQDVYGFVLNRGSELFKVGEDDNTTWTWRIQQWEYQLGRFSQAPLTGLGFGGYWGDEELSGETLVSPHNLYVQILVKLGLVGLGIYLLLALVLFRMQRHALDLPEHLAGPDRGILILGFLVLIASHIYAFAYAFNAYALIFVGLSMAVAGRTATEPLEQP